MPQRPRSKRNREVKSVPYKLHPFTEIVIAVQHLINGQPPATRMEFAVLNGKILYVLPGIPGLNAAVSVVHRSGNQIYISRHLPPNSDLVYTWRIRQRPDRHWEMRDGERPLPADKAAQRIMGVAERYIRGGSHHD